MSKYPQVNTNDRLWMMIFVKIISIYKRKNIIIIHIIKKIWNKEWKGKEKKEARVKIWFIEKISEGENESIEDSVKRTSTWWLMFSPASCEYIEFKRVAQSVIALFVDSVDEHKEKIPNAESSTQCAFSISWKIVKVFTASRKKVQNAFNVKNRKNVPEKKWNWFLLMTSLCF